MLVRAPLRHTVSQTCLHSSQQDKIKSDMLIALRSLIEYLDTTIILNAADSTFADTLGLTDATSSGLKTSDNKVYTVASIKIQSHTYNL